MKAILSCSCAGTPKYCESAYRALFPNEKRVPVVYIKNRARPLLEDVPRKSRAYEELLSVMRRHGKYGFYLEYNEEGEILDYWNLLKSRRVS